MAERLKDVRYDIKSFKEISCHPSITVGCVESMGIYLLDEFYNSMVKRNNKVKMYFVLSTLSGPAQFPDRPTHHRH